MQAEILPILQREGVLHHFTASVYGDSVKRLKPDPEPYLLAKSLLGVSRALVLEDSAAGQASGRAAGCDVLEIRHCSEVPHRLASRLAETTAQ
jgi:beta-phosphoglucomutase-like phosphatase (HAD superfamily)